MKHAFAFVPIFALCALLSGTGTAWSGTVEAGAFSGISGVLNDRCVKCHSGDKPADGLRLDTYENVMAGTKHGPVVVAGQPAKSPMIRRIKGTAKPRMPIGGPPWLSKEETAAIEAWIGGGALR